MKGGNGTVNPEGGLLGAAAITDPNTGITTDVVIGQGFPDQTITANDLAGVAGVVVAGLAAVEFGGAAMISAMLATSLGSAQSIENVINGLPAVQYAGANVSDVVMFGGQAQMQHMIDAVTAPPGTYGYIPGDSLGGGSTLGEVTAANNDAGNTVNGDTSGIGIA